MWEFEIEVEEIIQRTYNVKSFRFPRPKEATYKPGQFMFITIKVDGEEKQKHFTISSSPTEEEHLEFTKKLTGHEFSNALDGLTVGDWARLRGSFGRFTFEGEQDRIGMISGGIGITPLRSICKYCMDRRLEADIVLLYSNRSERDIAFRDEFEEMVERNEHMRVVHTLTEPSPSWKGHRGRINRITIEEEIPDYRDRIFYTCGPPGMVQAMTQILKDLGISKEQIMSERFSGY